MQTFAINCSQNTVCVSKTPINAYKYSNTLAAAKF